MVLLVASSPRPAGAQASEPEIEVRSDISLEASDGTALTLDAYLPKDGAANPAIVLVHGGSWAGGDKRQIVDLAASLASRGWATFAPNYRLGVELVERQADDISDTVRWVRSHARRYRVDPDAISMVGASAGAHLGALAVTQAEEDSRVAAFVAWSGIFDLVALAPREGASIPDCNQACQEIFGVGFLTGLIGCSRTECPDRYRDASPIRHVTDSAPPMFLAATTNDAVPPAQTREMAAALERVGVEVEAAVVKGDEHGYEVGARTLDRTLDFLKDRRLATTSSDSPVLWLVLGGAAALVLVVSVITLRRRSATSGRHGS